MGSFRTVQADFWGQYHQNFKQSCAVRDKQNKEKSRTIGEKRYF